MAAGYADAVLTAVREVGLLAAVAEAGAVLIPSLEPELLCRYGLIWDFFGVF